MARDTPALTLGVEEEYLLVDPHTGELADQPPELMPRLREVLGERVSHEFLTAQLEVSTPVCGSTGEIRSALRELRGTVAGIAAEFDLAIVAASTHPLASWRRQRPVDLERYRILSRDFQALARRLVVCGMHVHTGIADPDLRIDLMNQLVYFLPHLLALSTSSPFWEGTLTGLKAFRPTIFGDLPRSGVPERFASYRDWEGTLEMLARSGLCDDPSKIWWDVRPSVRQPTVEMRVCDVCTRLEDAVTIVALYEGIVRLLLHLRAHNQSWRSYRRLFVEENKWRAQRWGVEAELADLGALTLKPFALLMEELLELIDPHLPDAATRAQAARARTIVREGTSADRQIRVYREARAAGADDHEARRAVARWLMVETLRDVDVPLAPLAESRQIPDPGPEEGSGPA